MPRRSLVLFAALALPALAGCGGGAVVVAPVTGKVMYAGKPAVGVRVFFVPQSAPGIPLIPANPHGVTGPDGGFSLATFEPDDGAAAGTYQVVLSWPPEAGDNLEEGEGDRLRGWYTAARSQLTAVVPEGGGVIPTFDLPGKSAAPEAFTDGIPGRN